MQIFMFHCLLSVSPLTGHQQVQAHAASAGSGLQEKRVECSVDLIAGPTVQMGAVLS